MGTFQRQVLKDEKEELQRILQVLEEGGVVTPFEAKTLVKVVRAHIRFLRQLEAKDERRTAPIR
jgi:hypothetical protein